MELSKAEELFLVAIWRLKDNAYGVSVRDSIAEMTGKVYTYGTLYGLLDQIVHRGYAKKIEGEPTAERGGRRKLFYRLTREGTEALTHSFEVQQSVWKDIDRSALDNGIEYE
jgi:DNA-binding PadR family transcriptional regulator